MEDIGGNVMSATAHSRQHAAKPPFSPIKWYLFCFLVSFKPIYPLYAIMFTEHSVSPAGLSVLFAFWFLTAFLAEVPSGALADRFSRKWILAIAQLMHGGVFVVWWFFPTFWGFLAGFLIWGLGGSLHSGTAESWLYDTLASTGHEREFTRLYGRGGAFGKVAVFLSMSLGGVLGASTYGPALAASTATGICAAFVAACFFHDVRQQQSTAPPKYLDILRSAVTEARGNRQLLYWLLAGAALFSVPQAFDEFVGPILWDQGYSRPTVGVVFGIIYAVQAGGMAVAHRFSGVTVSRLMGIGLLCALCLALAAAGVAWLTPPGIALFFGLAVIIELVTATRVQDRIQGHARATVTSLQKGVRLPCEMLTLFVFGLAAEPLGMTGGIGAVFALLVLLIAASSLLARQWRIA